jgi:hypothetical protein
MDLQVNKIPLIGKLKTPATSGSQSRESTINPLGKSQVVPCDVGPNSAVFLQKPEKLSMNTYRCICKIKSKHHPKSQVGGTSNIMTNFALIPVSIDYSAMQSMFF